MAEALYFMPDISGFSNFVNDTEIEHSIHIIAELLELLLDNNPLELQLVEIEGDALFMFSTKIPSYKELMQQTETMLEEFHRHTKEYDTKRICTCGSCKTTIDLDLKFLVHYGELTMIKVKNIIKPYGREVIQIHRLLKNQIPVQEYVLFTENMYMLYQDNMIESWTKKTEIYDLQNLNYFYKILDNIKLKVAKDSEIEAEKNEDITIPDATINKTFNANIQTIHRYLSELKYRHIWDKEVMRVEFDENEVNRVGTEHNCVLKLGTLKFETISRPSKDSLIYGEKTEGMILLRKFYYLVKLHSLDFNTTEVSLSLYLEYTFLGRLLKRSILKRITKMWQNKLESLHRVTKSVISQ
ncbi:Protein of unknown function [Flavobacterium gillisiae]|uniref:DUF2652 domain-containing protein n=1 Tax=Flavobacterium gillisiae TaxID=150146 RepID=A0A1H4D420_9FLAO|nr:DUF2652 domain-containing protein [Flavobacterium gillisiae]SEA67367.1 Protein of unknown function [Flavobacterium gillisiae]